MKVFKVVVGDYDEKTYYIVRGAKDADDALAQVKAWYEANYEDDCWWASDTISIEEIAIKKGVTRL